MAGSGLILYYGTDAILAPGDEMKASLTIGAPKRQASTSPLPSTRPDTGLERQGEQSDLRTALTATGFRSQHRLADGLGGDLSRRHPGQCCLSLHPAGWRRGRGSRRSVRGAIAGPCSSSPLPPPNRHPHTLFCSPSCSALGRGLPFLLAGLAGSVLRGLSHLRMEPPNSGHERRGLAPLSASLRQRLCEPALVE